MTNTRLYIRCFSKIIGYLNPVIILYNGIKKMISFYKNENIFADSNNFQPDFEMVKQEAFVNSSKDSNINFCNKIV